MMRYLIEFAIIHTVLIGAYWVFLKNERQYGRLRLYLLASTLLSLFVPALRLPAIQSFFTPDSPVTVFVTQMEPIQYIVPAETPGTAPVESSFNLLPWLYVIISALLLLKVIMGLSYLIKLRISSEKDQIFGISLRKVFNLSGSFSFFNWIFIGKEIEEKTDELLPIVKHEHAHVRLGHSYDLIFFQVFRVAFWWLPSAWYINQEIKKIHEFQADAYALKSYSVDQYSSILISSTLKSNGLSLASSFHDGLIIKRLKAMKQQMKKISPWKLSALGVLTALMVITFACNEEMDAEIQKMGERSNSIPFDQLPASMQNETSKYKEALSFIRYTYDEGENPGKIKELQELDRSTVFSTFVQQETQEIFVALKKDGDSFNYLSEKSKSDGDVLTIVEEQPEFEGGMAAFYQFVAENMNYPTEARKVGIEGRVYVQFVVNTDGSVTDVIAKQGIGAGCDEEAIRVIKAAPDFIPGKQKGQNVRVRMVLPIIFKLSKSDSKAALDKDSNTKMKEITELALANSDLKPLKVQTKFNNGLWSGVVTDLSGNPLSGARIIVVGTTEETVSGSKREFSISTEEDAKLDVRYDGYSSVRVMDKGSRQAYGTLKTAN